MEQERKDSWRVKTGSGKMRNVDVSLLWYVYFLKHTIRVRVGSKSSTILLTLLVFEVLMI